MPIIKSAKKKLRADSRKKIVNLKIKTRIKSALKKFKSSLSADSLSEAYSALDVAAKKGFLPKSRADRKKSRLANFFAAIPKSQPKSRQKKRLKKQASISSSQRD